MNIFSSIKKSSSIPPSIEGMLDGKIRTREGRLYVNETKAKELLLLRENLIPIAIMLFNMMPWLKLYGDYYAQDVAKKLARVIKHSGISLRKRWKNVDLLFNCLDGEKILAQEYGFLVNSPVFERKFWNIALSKITLSIGTEAYTINAIASLFLIYKIERILGILPQYRLKFTRLPAGKVKTRGLIHLDKARTIRETRSSLNKETGDAPLLFDFTSATLYCGDKVLTSGIIKKLEGKNIEPMIAKVPEEEFKYLHGKRRFEIIQDDTCNAIYMYLTKTNGKSICVRGYESCCNSAPDLELEMDLTKLKNYSEDTEDCLEVYPVVRPTISGFYGIDRYKLSDSDSDISVVTNDYDNVVVSVMQSADDSIFPLESNTSFQEGHKVILEIPTPTCVGGIAPTILAQQGQNVSLKSAISTGNYPDFCILQFIDAGESTYGRNSARYIRAAINSELVEHRFAGSDEEYAMWLDKISTRKISNSSMGKIVEAIRKMSDSQYIRVRPLTPKEKFAYMGHQPEIVDKLSAVGITEQELNDLAGNGIVPQVLSPIYEDFFVPDSQRPPFNPYPAIDWIDVEEELASMIATGEMAKLGIEIFNADQSA